MSAWYALAGASFLVAMAGGIMGNVYYIRMIGAINQVKREGPPIPVFGWETPNRSQLIFREYRRLYPDGRLHVNLRIAHAVAAVGIVSVMVCVFMARG